MFAWAKTDFGYSVMIDFSLFLPRIVQESLKMLQFT